MKSHGLDLYRGRNEIHEIGKPPEALGEETSCEVTESLRRARRKFEK